MTEPVITRIVDLTQEQLLAAWKDRARQGWPHSFEMSMEHPLLRRIIQIHAAHQLGHIAERRAGVVAPDPSAYVLEQEQRRRAIRRLDKRLHQAALPLDQKSLASGEKPEPD